MSSIKVQENVDLFDKTTFRIGGVAKYYVEVSTPQEIKRVMEFAKDKSVEMFILGGGSNILIRDEGMEDLVVKYTNKRLEFEQKDHQVYVTAGAGLEWDRLVEECVKMGLQGVECMSGIPGSVGAAPIQNIGAYGQEIEDVFVDLDAYDLKQDRVVTLNKAQCGFDYRDSMFKYPKNQGRYFIMQIKLLLNKHKEPKVEYQSLKEYFNKKNIADPTIMQVRQAVLDIRAQKLEDPSSLGNAGSFFKNPIIEKGTLSRLKEKYPDIPVFRLENGKFKLFAGWLIDKAGWKGRTVGGARVSRKNALVITNPGKASSKDIVRLARAIQKDIKDKFGVDLEPEVNIL